MAVLKSQEVYVNLLLTILEDVESITGLNLVRDQIEIQKRADFEGISFLTRTLPGFYKHILRSIEDGMLSPVAGFKKQRGGPLPKFLGGLVSMLFNPDGSLKQDRDAYALAYIGQICTVLYKCEFPYTAAMMRKRSQKYLDVEQQMPEYIDKKTVLAELTLSNAIFLLQTVFKGFTVESGPKHGPGAVAGREKGVEKYAFSFSEKIDEHFRYSEWFASYSAIGRAADFQHALSQDTELQTVLDSKGYPLPDARGIFVNKDARGPRFISAEPKESMWIQQAVGESIRKWIERHPLTRGHCNFTDQSVNGALALSSSVDRAFSTLDMEDASDRLSNALVSLLMPVHVNRLLQACRSETSTIPGQSQVVRLRKFAPMGSACCFPIESIMFWALTVACISAETGWGEWKASRHVYVYGDDIIVTSRFAEVVIRTLSEYYLAFNKAKCFTKGPFRESCGIDALDGIIVTPVKMRKLAPLGRSDTAALISWVDASNQLFYAGYWKSAAFLADHVEQTCRIKLRYVPFQSGALGVTGYQPVYQVPQTKGGIRWSTRYHCLQVRVQRLRALDGIPLNQFSGSLAPSTLLMSLNKPEKEIVSCEKPRVTTMMITPAKRFALGRGWKTLS